MKTLKEPRDSRTAPTGPRRVRPVVAFAAAAFVMVAAIGAVMLVQGGESDSADQQSITTTTTALEATQQSIAEESVTTATTAADEAPPPPGGTDAPPPEPIPGKSMAEGAISLTDDSPGVMVSAAVDANDRLVVAYWAENDETLKVIRCVDTGCVQTPETFTLASIPKVMWEEGEAGVGFVDMVLKPDGAPIVIADNPFDSPTVYACVDADCTSVESSDFTTPARIDWPHLALAPDGTPGITYFTRHPDKDVGVLEMAVCGNAVCSADRRTTVLIDDDLPGFGEGSIQIDPNGRILIGYESTAPGVTQARVALCADDTCSTGPTVLTFDDAVGARTTAGTDGGFWVWYRSGSAYEPEGELIETTIQAAWDLMVASCGDTGCDPPTEVDVGWAMLMAWPGDIQLVSLGDGVVAAAFGYWSSELCDAPLEVRVLDPRTAQMGARLGFFLGGYVFDAAGTDNGVAAVFGVDPGGLEAVELAIGGPAPAELVPVCQE